VHYDDPKVSRRYASTMRRDRFRIAVRQHTIIVDQPVSDGGEDTAPLRPSSSLPVWPRAWPSTPPLCRRHDIPTNGLAVTADFSMASHPARWRDRASAACPAELSPELQASLLAVTSHCTVHSTLMQRPEVRIELAALTPGPCEQAGAARRAFETGGDPMQLDESAITDVLKRLRRAEGQIAGHRHARGWRDCADVVTQLAQSLAPSTERDSS